MLKDKNILEKTELQSPLNSRFTQHAVITVHAICSEVN